MNSPKEIAQTSKKDYFTALGYDWELVEKILGHDRKYRSIQKSQTDVHHLIARVRG